MAKEILYIYCYIVTLKSGAEIPRTCCAYSLEEADQKMALLAACIEDVDTYEFSSCSEV